ncbi:MAG: type I-F CRISPR-associated endoribonuclease Cas6/Csy4 [Pseudomonadota bacterium]|nr:type I-F CRISPR-associated endoribonuclease Cas6/Csy4 [Pseudomonadota bacterium]
MKAKCYIDFSAITMEGIVPYDVIAKAFHVLHGVFGGSVGKYAIALPKARSGSTKRSVGNVIRIFAGNASDLYALLDKVRGHHLMRDYVQTSVIKDVPADFRGSWSVHRRARIQKNDGINRDVTILRAKESPYLEIRSSKGGVFPLRIIVEKGMPQATEFEPNSYGLAAIGNRNGAQANFFSLPDL